MRKKPIFLLEIVIAMALVGLFSVYFLRSSIQALYQERKAFLALEFDRAFDLKRMELIGAQWNNAETLPAKAGKPETVTCTIEMNGKSYSESKDFALYCPKQTEKCYDLVLQEGTKKEKKTYHFTVFKQLIDTN